MRTDVTREQLNAMALIWKAGYLSALIDFAIPEHAPLDTYEKRKMYADGAKAGQTDALIVNARACDRVTRFMLVEMDE